MTWAMLALALFGAVVWVLTKLSERRPAQENVWARPREVKALHVDHGGAPGRVVLGRAGRHLIATEKRHSVLVIGPTDTMKTTGLAEPAILEWDGPVLAFSVKADLVRHTLARRQELGDVWAYDPFHTTDLPCAGWSPLAVASTWAGARRSAEWMCAAAKAKAPGPGSDDFWHHVAGMHIAPRLLAAATAGLSMDDVIHWIARDEKAIVFAALKKARSQKALDMFHADADRDDKQRSGVLTTAQVVLEPFSDDEIAASMKRSDVTARRLLDGGKHTLYVCAPSDEQERYEPVFTTMARQFLAVAMRKGAKEALDPPLLVVIDEAANIAPIRNLPQLASTAAAHGIQLLTVFQDLAQIESRYNDAAKTVLNNHRAKVVLGGGSDTDGLRWVQAMVGDALVRQRSRTKGDGRESVTDSTTHRPVAPPDATRQIQPGHAVVLYGHLPPLQVRLRPWFQDKALRALVEGDGTDGEDEEVVDETQPPEPEPEKPDEEDEGLDEEPEEPGPAQGQLDLGPAA